MIEKYTWHCRDLHPIEEPVHLLELGGLPFCSGKLVVWTLRREKVTCGGCKAKLMRKAHGRLVRERLRAKVFA